MTNATFADATFAAATITIPLGFNAAPGIALGAYLNNRICVVRGSEALVSPHIGDLDSRDACQRFEASVTAMLAQVAVEPEWVATDLHPDFYSTRFGCALADARQIPFIQVQHHHAHIGALIAEHQLSGAVIGLALDGFGLGTDGEAWGGELLLVDGRNNGVADVAKANVETVQNFERLGHLHPLPLPGGDRAAREPWRMAAAALFELQRANEIVPRFGTRAALIDRMIEQGLNSPRTSSAGRLFDAAAGLLGIAPQSGSEGEAAIMLEQVAVKFGAVAPLASAYTIEQRAPESTVLNMLPLLAKLADMRDTGHAAALFHASLAAALADWVERVAQQRQIDQIVLGGGCFHNRILSKALRIALEAKQLKVFEATKVSPGDGGLSLGQAWVAAHNRA